MKKAIVQIQLAIKNLKTARMPQTTEVEVDSISSKMTKLICLIKRYFRLVQVNMTH